jgi:hypothetical protein
LFGGRFASQIVDALKAAPTLSLVAEIGDLFDVDRGIYINSVNSGPAWERPVSVEMIYPDGSVGFQENAGIRSGAVRDGTDFAWKALRTASRDVKSNDRQQSNAAYQRLLGKNAQGVDDPALEILLDLENYIDYLIMNFYGGNTDRPHKNYYVARQRGPQSTGLKFFSWDAEKILNGGGSDLTTNQTGQTAGEIYFTLDGTDPRQHEWDPALTASGISPTAVRYEGPVALPAGVVVKARTLADGQCSALNEASFQLAPPPLRISEVMYHPRDPQDGEAGDAEDFEIVELVNDSPIDTVNLTGVAFTDGIEFVCSSGTLQPGQRTVVVRSREAFAQRYGDQVSVAGEYGEGSNLSNGGESLRLVDRFDQLIQEFTYDDAVDNSTWSEGDWNCDGDFDSRDLVLAFSASEYLAAARPARTLAPPALTARLHDEVSLGWLRSR